MRKKTIPVLSFFTGGGLFDLGLEQAGFKACWTNEYNGIRSQTFMSMA